MNPVSSKTKTLLYVHRALEDIANALQYPQTELYQLIIGTNEYCNEVEDIVDSPVFEDCKLKIRFFKEGYRDGQSYEVESRNI